jgi:hypothetical protein
MHQGQQRKCFRCLADRMLRQDRGQPDRFVAKLAADRDLGAGRKVTLRKQQVHDLGDRGQPCGTLLARKLPERSRQCAQTAACSTEAFVHIGFAGEQPQRDLANVEAAQGFQREHQL